MSNALDAWHKISSAASKVGVPIDSKTTNFVESIYGESRLPEKAGVWTNDVISPLSSKFQSFQGDIAGAAAHWEGEAFERFRTYMMETMMIGMSSVLDTMEAIPKGLLDADTAINNARTQLTVTIIAAAVALAGSIIAIAFFGAGIAGIIATVTGVLTAIAAEIASCSNSLSDVKNTFSKVMADMANVRGLVDGGPPAMSPSIGDPGNWIPK